MRCRVVFPLLAFLFGACAGKKLSQGESFLKSPQEGKSHFYFYSILPEKPDESGQFVCALMTSFSSNGFANLSAEFFLHNGQMRQTVRTSYFVETLQKLNEENFPVEFLSTEMYEGRPEFMHSVARNKITCKIAAEGGTELDYSVKFPSQSSLSPSAHQENLGVHSLAPIMPAKLDLGESLPPQASILCVHSLDSLDLLLKSRRTRTYFWLDYVVEGQAESIFFSVDASAQSTVHFNSHPTQVIPFIAADFPTSKPPLDQASRYVELELKGTRYSLMPVASHEFPALKPFWLGTVRLDDKSGGISVALGNLFVL